VATTDTGWTLATPCEEGVYEFVELDCQKSLREVRVLRIPSIRQHPPQTLWYVRDGKPDEEGNVPITFIGRRSFRCWRGPIRAPDGM